MDGETMSYFLTSEFASVNAGSSVLFTFSTFSKSDEKESEMLSSEAASGNGDSSGHFSASTFSKSGIREKQDI